MCSVSGLKEKAISGTDILSLLKEALCVAADLELDEFSAWINHELFGYEDRDSIPPYRSFHGDVVKLLDDSRYEYVAKDDDLPLQRHEFMGPISTVVSLYDDQKDGYVDLDLNSVLNAYLRKYNGDSEYRLRVRSSQLYSTMETISSLIVNWINILEKNGISETISKEELQKEKTFREIPGVYITIKNAADVKYGGTNMDNRNYFSGSATGIQIQQGTTSSSQSQCVNAEIDFNTASDIIENILNYQVMFESEFGERSKELMQALDNAKDAIERKDKTKLKSAWDWIKAVASSATGSVIAQGICSLLAKVPV